jgi:hypothetical protein
MPFRDRLRRSKARIEGIFQTRDGQNSSASLVNNSLAPVESRIALRSEPNLTTANLASPPPVSPPADTTITLNSQNESSLGNVPAQLPSQLPGSVSMPVASAASGASTSGWTSLKTFLRVLDQASGAFGPLKVVVDELVICTGIYEVRLSALVAGVYNLPIWWQREANGREEYETLRKQLEGLFEELEKHFPQTAPPAMTMSMEGLCR